MNKTTDMYQLISDDLDLSSLPDIYNRISALLSDENSTHEQIAEVIQSDPALTLRILKVVNSSFYGYPQQISTITQAIGILGRRSLRNIILSTIVAGMCRRMSNDIFEMEAYWEHSVRTAVLTRLLTLQSDHKNEADTVFIAGLLHDIGKLVIAHQLPEQASEIQLRELDTDQRPWEIEMDVLGFDHTELGAALMEKWNLPDLLVDIIRYHHEPEKATRCQQCSYIICLADRLSYFPDNAEAEAFQQLLQSMPDWPVRQIDDDMLPELMASATEQFQQVLAMFR